MTNIAHAANSFVAACSIDPGEQQVTQTPPKSVTGGVSSAQVRGEEQLGGAMKIRLLPIVSDPLGHTMLSTFANQ
jgi:hypothetical protein